MTYKSAVKCALIHVNKIIEIMGKISDIECNCFISSFTGDYTDGLAELENWQAVKAELEKL
jgi:hypothetical protein